MFGMVCSDGKGGVCEIGTGAEITERELLPDGRQVRTTSVTHFTSLHFIFLCLTLLTLLHFTSFYSTLLYHYTFIFHHLTSFYVIVLT